MPGPHSIPVRLKAASDFVEITLANPDLLAGFARANRGAAYFEAGRALHAETLRLHKLCPDERGERVGAAAARNAALRAARKTYTKHVRYARLVFKHDADAYEALGLNGRRKTNLAGWLDQAEGFYEQLLSDADRKAKMAERGVTEAALTDARATLAAVAEADRALRKESAESVEATRRRDATLGQLEAWLSEARETGRLVFAEEPMHLRLLGL